MASGGAHNGRLGGIWCGSQYQHLVGCGCKRACDRVASSGVECVKEYRTRGHAHLGPGAPVGVPNPTLCHTPMHACKPRLGQPWQNLALSQLGVAVGGIAGNVTHHVACCTHVHTHVDEAPLRGWPAQPWVHIECVGGPIGKTLYCQPGRWHYHARETPSCCSSRKLLARKVTWLKARCMIF